MKNNKKEEVSTDSRNEKQEETKEIENIISEMINWTCLPPRIITSEILCFYEFKINDLFNPQKKKKKKKKKKLKNENLDYEFCCFGYFKKDRLRNIWFLFKSIDIYNIKQLKNIILNLNDIQYINFNSISKPIEFKNYLFPSLKKLKIFNSFLNDSFFQVDGRFSTLKFLELKNLSEGVKGIKWNPKMTKSLKRITIRRCDIEDSFFQTHEFPNLEMIRISKLPTLVTGDKWKKHKKLKTLILDELNVNDDFLRLKFIKNLKNLELILCQQLDGGLEKNVDMGKIEFLKIKYCKNIKSNFFNNYLFPALKFLVIKKMDLSEVKYWNSFKNLEKLDFQNVTILDYFFQNQIYNNLYKIKLWEVKGIGGENWNEHLGKTIKIIKIGFCFDLKIDAIFKEIHFEKLEELYLDTLNYFRGQDWKEMNQLKKLSLIAITIKDYFFREDKGNNCENLESLVLMRCHSLKGENWNKEFAKNLKELEIHSCNKLTDQIFFNNSFSKNLEVLNMKYFDSFSRKKMESWTKFTKLKKILFYWCDVQDDFFQYHEFDNLENIIILKCNLITGTNWNKFPKKLKKIYFGNCQKLKFMYKNEL